MSRSARAPEAVARPPSSVKGGRGGVRVGAGRKPGNGRRLVLHRARGAHSPRHPVHVVLRSRFKSLRTQFVFPSLRHAFAAATRARPGFRITQFSVQGDHVHLIVEAASKSALSRGMQGLAVRVARAVNGLVNRRGTFWADRFFSRELSSPRAVRHALSYVLNNFRKHCARDTSRIDAYSSAPYFDGFVGLAGRPPIHFPPHIALPLCPRGVSPPHSTREVPVVRSHTWLGKHGWKRAGTIGFSTIGRAASSMTR